MIIKTYSSYAVEIYAENSVSAGREGSRAKKRRGKIRWDWVEQSLLNIAIFGDYFIVVY